SGLQWPLTFPLPGRSLVGGRASHAASGRPVLCSQDRAPRGARQAVGPRRWPPATPPRVVTGALERYSCVSSPPSRRDSVAHVKTAFATVTDARKLHLLIPTP